MKCSKYAVKRVFKRNKNKQTMDIAIVYIKI